MDISIPRRIVRVEAIFDGNKRKRGTGLRLKSGWILTSQHVLERSSAKGVERAHRVEVALPAPGGEESPSVPATVEWWGEPKGLDTDNLFALDAVLLSEKELLPVDGKAIRLVPHHLPSGRCEVAGWIRASSLSDRKIAPEELQGTFSAIDEAATILPLRIEGLEPERSDPDSPSPYGGVSGAPVFVASGRFEGWLYGLVRKGPKAQPDRLWAVSTPALLRNDRFQQTLAGEEPEWFEGYVELVRSKLDGDETAKIAVRQIIDSAGRCESDEALARAAVREETIGDVCMALAQAARQLDRDGATDSAERMRAVLTAVAPVRFSRSMGIEPPAEEIRRLDLDVASDLGAEAIVAAMQRRSMELEPVPGDIPRPKWVLSPPGVFGIDLDGSDAVGDIVEELRKLVKLAPQPSQAARAYLVHQANELGLLPESLLRQVSALKEDDEVWNKVVSRAVNRRLAALNTSERYYFQIALDEGSEHQEGFLRRLGDDLPALPIVTRSSRDPDQLDAEDAQLQSPLEHAFTRSNPSPEDEAS